MLQLQSKPPVKTEISAFTTREIFTQTEASVFHLTVVSTQTESSSTMTDSAIQTGNQMSPDRLTL